MNTCGPTVRAGKVNHLVALSQGSLEAEDDTVLLLDLDGQDLLALFEFLVLVDQSTDLSRQPRIIVLQPREQLPHLLQLLLRYLTTSI